MTTTNNTTNPFNIRQLAAILPAASRIAGAPRQRIHKGESHVSFHSQGYVLASVKLISNSVQSLSPAKGEM